MTAATLTTRQLRLAGLGYLAIIGLGLWTELGVRNALIVPGDAVATAQHIAAHPLLWRAGLAADLLMQVLDLPLIAVFYLLLRPVNHVAALTATGLNLVQTAVLVANRLNLLLPLFLQDDAAYLQAFSFEQRAALSQVALNLHAHGFAIGLVFFGVACVIRGWLIARSAVLPRVLGAMLALAGLCYLLNSVALLLAPSLAAALFPAVLVPAFLGELALSLWLLVRGARVAA